jgi:hypothetical protein
MTTRRILLLFTLLPVLHATEPAPSPTPSPEPTPAPVSAPGSGEWVDGLDNAQVQKALELFEINFQGAEKLDAAAKQRALLEGFGALFAPGIGFGSGTTAVGAGAPFLAEILDGQAGYIRPGTLDEKALGQTDAALENFSGKQVPAVILDLRAVAAGGDMESAAEFARRFSPKGKILFTIQNPSAKQERILTSDKDPQFSGILLVLVDSGTSGASEVLAATLREHAGAMVVGAATAGEGVEFGEFSLGGDKVLRVAVSRVVMPVGGALFPDGVRPDVPVEFDPELRDRVFQQSQTGGVSRFVFDVEQPRMNEAALVARTNPEISAGKSEVGDALRDPVLQRAVDLVTAIRFFKK